MRRYFTIPGWLLGMGIIFAYKYGKYKAEAKMYKKAEARAQAAECAEESVDSQETPVEPAPEPAQKAEPEEPKQESTRKVVYDTIADAVNALLGVNGKDRDKG